jgi:hypothetical protein
MNPELMWIQAPRSWQKVVTKIMQEKIRDTFNLADTEQNYDVAYHSCVNEVH